MHSLALNWLYSGALGPVLSDETEMCSFLTVEDIAKAEIPV